MKRRELAAWGEPKDRANVEGPAILRRPVEVPIGGLNQCPWSRAVRHFEAVQRRECAAWGDFEDRATTGAAVSSSAGGGPALRRCAVEVSIRAQEQPRFRVVAIRAIALRAEVVKRGQPAAGVILKTVPQAWNPLIMQSALLLAPPWDVVP